MNQPPPTEKHTSKRIVSKGEYALVQGDRLVSRLIALVFFLLSGTSALMVLYCTFLILSGKFLADNMTNVDAMSVPRLMIFAPLTYCLYRAGHNAIDRANSRQPVIPLTRANTADLPAPDSLVRASAEPVQEPQAVLLRAATESVERHEEQLVRPVE